eukprot:1159163-Pelagomonas_calceolata.AAC.3
MQVLLVHLSKVMGMKKAGAAGPLKVRIAIHGHNSSVAGTAQQMVGMKRRKSCHAVTQPRA